MCNTTQQRVLQCTTSIETQNNARCNEVPRSATYPRSSRWSARATAVGERPCGSHLRAAPSWPAPPRLLQRSTSRCNSVESVATPCKHVPTCTQALPRTVWSADTGAARLSIRRFGARGCLQRNPTVVQRRRRPMTGVRCMQRAGGTATCTASHPQASASPSQLATRRADPHRTLRHTAINQDVALSSTARFPADCSAITAALKWLPRLCTDCHGKSPIGRPPSVLASCLLRRTTEVRSSNAGG
jgi:hypothetical protein